MALTSAIGLVDSGLGHVEVVLRGLDRQVTRLLQQTDLKLAESHFLLVGLKLETAPLLAVTPGVPGSSGRCQ